MIVKFENITKIYPPKTPQSKAIVALENVSFEVERGEFVSIVGKSGAGKTTLVKLLLALEKPTFGRIFLDDVEISQSKPNLLLKTRRKIGVIYQDYKLLSKKTVFENIAYILVVRGVKDEEIQSKVSNILKLTSLSEKAYNFPEELSGGEQQRVAIARAIVDKPELILADEPTGNLDPYHTYEVISLLRKINELGKTVILATHNKEIVNRLGKRVITLEEGRIIRDEKEGRFIL